MPRGAPAPASVRPDIRHRETSRRRPGRYPEPNSGGRQTRAPATIPEEGTTLASATKVKVKPLEDRVLVTVDDDTEQTTASGLVIPDTAKEKPQQGKVVAVGPGKRSEQSGDKIKLDIDEGDTVLFSKYGGTEVKVEGEEYLILSARDILAVVG